MMQRVAKLAKDAGVLLAGMAIGFLAIGVPIAGAIIVYALNSGFTVQAL